LTKLDCQGGSGHLFTGAFETAHGRSGDDRNWRWVTWREILHQRVGEWRQRTFMRWETDSLRKWSRRLTPWLLVYGRSVRELRDRIEWTCWRGQDTRADDSASDTDETLPHPWEESDPRQCGFARREFRSPVAVIFAEEGAPGGTRRMLWSTGEFILAYPGKQCTFRRRDRSAPN